MLLFCVLQKESLLFKFKWWESNVLVNLVCSYFVSRSFTKLLLCSQIKAPFGLTPSSEDCGPKPKLKGQRLGTVWLLGIIRIEEKKKWFQMTSALKREIWGSIALSHLIPCSFELSQGESMRFRLRTTRCMQKVLFLNFWMNVRGISWKLGSKYGLVEIILMKTWPNSYTENRR